MKQPEVISLDPQYISDILDDIEKVGKATGTEEKAREIIASMSLRIEAVKQKSAMASTKPKVLSLEWVEPLMCGGHWVPEMVDIAGGENCFGDKETGSFKFEWGEVLEKAPDIIIFMPCGFDVKRGLQDIPILSSRDGWDSLPAVKNDQVYVIDASAYTSRSGPRLISGLEIMAEMIHPELFSGLIPESGALRVYGNLSTA
jgi:iron complex transport system substrate-binding protein